MLSICLDALESGCRLSKVKRAASVILGFQGLGLSGEATSAAEGGTPVAHRCLESQRVQKRVLQVNLELDP